MDGIGKMNKVIAALVFILLIAYPTVSQTKSDKEWDDLVGSVRMVVREDARIVNESGQYVEKNRVHWRTTSYDLQGNRIKEEPTPPTSAPAINAACDWEEPIVKRRYKQGKLAEERSLRRDGSIMSKDVWRYDLQGRKSEWRFYDSCKRTDRLKLQGRWVYRYNGNVIAATLYDGCCSVSRKDVSGYDDRGSIVENASYRTDGTQMFKTKYAYEYDSVGNWIKRILSSRTTENGKSVFEPREVIYRTITYY